MKYILGIDQGGTKTAVALMGTDGRIYGTGYETGAYFPVDGIEAAMQPMVSAIRQALAQASVSMEEIELAVAGVTGVDWAGDDEIIRRCLDEVLPAGISRVYNDGVIAMYGGTLRNYGAVICAGTGINAAICKKNGECFVYGDYLSESLQGGSALALRGARAVFDANVGVGEAKRLTKLYLDYTQTASVDELLQKYMTVPGYQDELRRIVPSLIALAIEGDERTNALLEQFASEISVYIIAGLANADMLQDSMEIVLAGSVFKGPKNPLTKCLTSRLQEAAPNANVIQAKYEPVVGACIMGLLEKHTITEEMSRQLAQSAEEMALLRH